MSVRLGQFMERSGVPPTTQFAYWKGLGTCDALLSVSHTLQSALESGQEAKVVSDAKQKKYVFFNKKIKIKQHPKKEIFIFTI